MPENLGKHCRESPANKTESEIELLTQENSKPRDPIAYTDGSVTKDQSGWGFTVKENATTIHEDSAADTVLIFNLQLDNGGGRSHSGLRWIASRDGSQPTCAIILIDSLSLLQKVKNGKGIKPRLTCVNVQYPPAETLVGVLPWACWSDGKL